MADYVPVPSLIVAIVILAVFVPLGLVGAVFALSRVIMAPRKWTRYIVEVHIAFQGVIVVAVIVPMLLTGYVMTFLESSLPYVLVLAQTLTIRVSQWLVLVSATVMTVKRVRTAMYGRFGHSMALQLTSVMLAWGTGLGIGIGSTLPTVGDFQFNRTVSETDFECQASDFSLECIGYIGDNYYGPVYLSMLLATSLIMLGGGVLVTRHIQSGMALAAPFAVFRPSASKNVLNDNVQLSFVVERGISQYTVPPGILLNNLVSETKTSVHVLPSPKVGTSYAKGGSGLHYTSPGPGSNEHISGCKSPEFSARNDQLDDNREDLRECDLEVLSILSGELSNHDYPRPDRAQANSSLSRSCYLDPLRNVSPQTSCEWTNSKYTLGRWSNSSLSSSTYDNRPRSPKASAQDYSSPTTSPLDATSPSSGRAERRRSPSAPDCLPDLKHARMSPSCISLRRRFVPSPTKSESHIDTQASSSSKNWPSLTEMLSLRYADPAGTIDCNGNSSPFRPDNKKQTQFMFHEQLNSRVGSNNKETECAPNDGPDQSGSRTSNGCLDRATKEQLNKTTKLTEGDDKQTCKSGKSYPPTPVQIRVVRPSTDEIRFLHRKTGRALDEAILSPKLQRESHVGATIGHTDGLKGTITSVDSEGKVCRIVSPLSVSRRQSTGSINFRESRIRNPIQLLSSNPGNLSRKEQKNARYKQSVIRRFILAFLVNVLTQIPYVVLQLAKPEYQTHKIVQPVVESISVISFALSTYIYVLDNTVIHKLLISTQK